MINTVVALFVELELLTAEEGEELARKWRSGTLPQDYTSAAVQVKRWLKEIKSA